MKRWALTLAVILGGCSKNASDQGERGRDPVAYPQIITSDQPPPHAERRVVEQKPFLPPRRRGEKPAAADNDKTRERTRYKEFYEQFDSFDTDYDQEMEGTEDEAMNTIMKGAIDPMAPPGPSSDDASPSNDPRPKNGAAAGADKPKREWYLACRPHVQLRKQANNTAGVVAKVPVGTKLSPVKARDVDEPASGWIQVDAGRGVRGWVSEKTAHLVNEGQEGTAYLECCNVGRDADDEASEPKDRFNERLDYLTCIEHAVGEIGDGHDAGDLQVAHAVALNRVAELVIRSDKPLDQPYRGFMQRYGDELAWDPEGYATKSGEMWTLEEKYHGTAAGDALGWQAAAFSAIERSCHHEVACAVAQARLHYGEYLKRYPDGAHASEACDAIAELRPRSATDDALQMDRNAQRVEQCLATIDQLNAIVQETHAVGRVQALGTLDGLRRFVLARSGHLQVTR